RGIPLRLIDTAGLRDSADELERAGIMRTGRALETADLLVHILDRNAPKPAGFNERSAEQIELVLLNKSDLPEHSDWKHFDALRFPFTLGALHSFQPRTRPRTIFGLNFPNPIGLAAGFDKNGVALPAWAALGFGFAEIGTVTARAQPGNPKPRIFRYPQQEALINRLGFNNDGAEVVAARLRSLRQSGRWRGIPVGINIGKSKVTPIDEATDDYLFSFRLLGECADYIVLNVSSPNTPDLRTLQGPGALDRLVRAVQKENQP